jgi:hypothetical protein
MPIHDWTRVDAGVFHDFHLSWTCAISRMLNQGSLPADRYSLVEEHKVAFGFELPAIGRSGSGDQGSSGVPDTRRPFERMPREPWPDPPEARLVAESELDHYRRKHKTVTIRHEEDHEVVVMVEVVSPADKHCRRAVRLFVEKVAMLLERDIHVLIVDLYPPGPLDPRGIHGAIWEAITGQDYVPPQDKPLTLAAYESQGTIRSYVEPVAVGDELPEMPLFLGVGRSVRIPLESTYQATWESWPRVLRDRIEGRSRS